jgi:hypothetical protein
MKNLILLSVLLLAACSNANSVDGVWLLDIAATREAKGYRENLSSDPNTEMGLNFLAQTESEVYIEEGKFHYLGVDCQISSVGDEGGVACMDKKGMPTQRTVNLKDNRLWLIAENGYPEIFVKVK